MVLVDGSSLGAPVKVGTRLGTSDRVGFIDGWLDGMVVVDGTSLG
jgi:hypothetical protein